MEAQHQHSHESDWIFLILLLVVALTGVLQHVLHRGGADVAANVAYVVHLMAVVPMLGLEVPFSKWSHMAYRPLAMYFSTLRRQMVPAPAPEEVARRHAERAGGLTVRNNPLDQREQGGLIWTRPRRPSSFSAATSTKSWPR